MHYRLFTPDNNFDYSKTHKHYGDLRAQSVPRMDADRMGRRPGLVCCYRCTKARSSANSTLKYVFLSCKSRYALWCKVRKLFPKYVDNTGYFRNYASNFPLFTFRTFTPYVLLPINLIGGRVSAFYGRKLAPTYPIKLANPLQ